MTKRTRWTLSLVLWALSSAPQLTKAQLPPAVEWHRVEQKLAPGVVHASLGAGRVATTARFDLLIGRARLPSETDRLVDAVRKAGGQPFLVYGPEGYDVRLPAGASRDEANPALVAWRSKGASGATGLMESPEILEIGQDAANGAGPWRVHVLEIDPRQADIVTARSLDAAFGLETTRSLARRHGAIAAVNGGYFVTRGMLRGDSDGVLQVDGRLLSEPDRERGAVAFWKEPERRPIFGRLVLEARLARGEREALALDGMNRTRGPREVVVYTPEFHGTTLTEPNGTECLVGSGKVREVRQERGSSPIPSDGFVISIGPERVSAAAGEFCAVGDAIALERDLLEISAGTRENATLRENSRGRDAWDSARSIVGGGPLLLRSGEMISDWHLETFPRAFCEARHPRTAVGVRPDGVVLLITVDGRAPEYSVGMTCGEVAALLSSLGATEALNLDGGGSTAMVVGGETVNRPSDPTGDRENGDALLVVPREPWRR